MKLFNVVKTDTKDWKIIGGKLATRIVKDTDKGISQDGKGTTRDFESYSYNYAVKKSIGKAAPKGVSASRQTSPPNLRLTGKMLDYCKDTERVNLIPKGYGGSTNDYSMY